MFKKTYFVFIAVFIFTLTAVSCSSKKSGSEQQPPAKLSVKNHIWYYFTADGFEKTDLPQNAPKPQNARGQKQDAFRAQRHQ